MADLRILPSAPPAVPDAHPWRDWAIALLFAAGMGVPGLALFVTWDESTTRFENRSMAEWPKLRLTRGFAIEFERAFSDRFGGRDLLLALHHRALVNVFGVSPVPNVVVGRDGWLYLGRSDIESWAVATSDAESHARTSAIVLGIARRVDVLRKLGSDYLLVVVPDKQSVYPEHLPTGAALPATSRLDDVLSALPADVRAHVLDLRLHCGNPSATTKSISTPIPTGTPMVRGRHPSGLPPGCGPTWRQRRGVPRRGRPPPRAAISRG